MSLESIAPVSDPDVARTALAWAADVAGDPTLLETPPRRPSPEEWRAVPLSVLRPELDRLLVGKFPEPALDALHVTGCLEVWLPEIAGLVGFGDGEWRHKDVWKHTKLVVKQSVPRLPVRWGALLHDIGKPRTRRIEPDGSVTFYGHSEVGAAMFRKRVASRLGFEGDLYDRIHFLILNHLRASQYDDSWTDSAVRRFYKQMGEGLRDLLDLSRADITTKRPERRKRGVRQISELGRHIDRVRSGDDKTPALPKGIGTLLSDAFGIPPSKKLGEVRRLLEEDVENGVIERAQDLEYYRAIVAADPARYGVDAT